MLALAESSGDERFAYDSYRRFIQMYSDVVLGVEHHHFEDILEAVKEQKGFVLDTDLDAADWRAIVEAYKAKVAGGAVQAVSAGPEASSSGARSAPYSRPG